MIVPIAEADVSEQTLRAGTLEAKGLVHMVRARDLSPENLAAAVNKALAAPPPTTGGIDVAGAENTAKWIATC